MTQMSLTIPQTVYERAKRLARLRNRPLDEVVAEAIALAEQLLTQEGDAEAKMAREEAAYLVMHEELLAHYMNAYVAIHQGQLIDHDQDEIALLRRLDANYPDEIVLMRQVTPEPEPVLQLRSPRFVNESL